MKKRVCAMLIFAICLLLCGCGKAVNASPQPLGELAALEYGRRVDMVWGENFSVRVARDEIVFIEYYVEADRDYRLETGIALEAGQWQELETAALASLTGMREIKAQDKTLWERLFAKEEPFMLDGADSTTLSFDWKTEEGIKTVSYNWNNDDTKVQELISLLKQLEQNVKGE